jgi:dTDP-4-dehydrorhamnose 3,5-epimerase-like enzyme
MPKKSSLEEYHTYKGYFYTVQHYEQYKLLTVFTKHNQEVFLMVRDGESVYNTLDLWIISQVEN